MWFQHKAWRPVAWLLAAANLAAVWFATNDPPIHATSHALLAVVFALGAQYLGYRQRITDGDAVDRSHELDAGAPDRAALDNVEGRLAELEERLDFTERALVEARRRAQTPPQG